MASRPSKLIAACFASLPAIVAGNAAIAQSAQAKAENFDAPEAERPGGIWEARVDTTLRQTIGEWSRKAGWQLVWRAEIDYRIAAPLAYRGRFLDALGAIFRDYATAERPLHVDVYRNRVIVVSPE